MKQRIQQLDYLKGIFILLMVTFHLALVEETYPVLRAAVYTFHMSAFLIISGYLANVEKPTGEFGKGLLRLLVPYVIFESLYILMQFYVGGSLGAHNAISSLSAGDFVLRVATLPTGPYWYIHTLIICTAVYWLVYIKNTHNRAFRTRFYILREHCKRKSANTCPADSGKSH